MTPLQLATEYLDLFCEGSDMEKIRDLLTEDCRFEGPFFQSDSASEYIESLKADPPKECAYDLVRAFEDEGSASIFYRFRKPGVSALMAQLFEIKDGKIDRILLVFDSADLS